MALTKLEIRLEAETTRLQKDLDKANRRINRWANKATKASKSVSKAFKRVGFAAGGAAVGVGLLVKNSLAAGDALAKTADKLGITTESLAGLQHAAELTGVAQETLNKALTKQQKAIFDADRGLLTYSQHFDKLGLSTKKLKEQSPDEQFKSIAEALNKLENQTDKTAIAYDIFGGRGTALLNTLALGREGLNKVAEEAKILGIALTRVDTAKMEEANDTFTRMKGVVKGLGNSITIAVAPVLDALGKQFIDAAKESGGMVNFVNKGMNAIVGAVGFVLDAFNALSVVWKGLEVAFAFTASVIVGLLNVIISPFKALLSAIAPFSLTAANALMFIEDVTTSTFDNIAAKQKEFNDALAAPPPSEGLKVWVAEVQAAAQKVAETKAATVAPSLGGIDVTTNPAITAKQEEDDVILNMEIALQEKLQAARKKSEELYSDLVKKHTAIAKGFRENAQNHGIALLQALGQKSKAFAIAAILVEKGIAIQRVIIQSKVAAMAALTPPPIGLGPVAGAGLAASITASGYASAGLIAATGALQLSSLGGGGGAPSIGSGGTQNVSVIDSVTGLPQSTSQATFIIVGGGGSSESELDELMGRVSERLNEGSQVIIRRDSVQAQEILAAAST